MVVLTAASEMNACGGITYKYDADGTRTSKTLANGQKTEYYYSGSTLMYEHRDITYNGAADGLSLYYTYNGSGQLSKMTKL